MDAVRAYAALFQRGKHAQAIGDVADEPSVSVFHRVDRAAGARCRVDFIEQRHDALLVRDGHVEARKAAAQHIDR